jgi:hypothetical protein
VFNLPRSTCHVQLTVFNSPHSTLISLTLGSAVARSYIMSARGKYYWLAAN